MPLVLGIARKSHLGEYLCTTDASDPVLDDFLKRAWAQCAELPEPSLGEGLYPLSIRAEYEIVGCELVRIYVEVVEGARNPQVDALFLGGLAATGRRVTQPMSFANGVRTAQISVLLEVPRVNTLVPVAPPEMTASFADAVRGVINRLFRSGAWPKGGQQVVDLLVAPIGNQWRVEPMRERQTTFVQRFVGVLRQAGLIAETDEASPSVCHVSLLVRGGHDNP